MALGELEITKSTLTVRELIWKIPEFSTLELDGEPYDGPRFTFLNYDWGVNIEPSDDNSEVYLYLDVDEYVGRSYDMMCTLGIIKADGSLARIRTCFRTLCCGYLECIGFCLIRREELMLCKTELMPSDNLTIMCHLQLLHDPMELRGMCILSFLLYWIVNLVEFACFYYLT